MTDLPSGTVTFLFTDIEGSTAMWERDRQAMRAAVDRQLAILQSLISAHQGVLFKTVGDGTQAAFASAEEALRAALVSQRALLAEDWTDAPGPLRVRMALHAGEAVPDPRGDYLAAPLNRLSRLLSTGYGVQILLSQAVQQLSRGALPAGTTLQDLGEHRLRDLLEPERVYQLRHPDLPTEFPPLTSLENRPNNLPRQPTPFLGREREVGEVVGLLQKDDVQLLTLVGPGGTGKTRLALQAAAELLDEFADGVFFVPLAGLSDPDLVLHAIAGAVSLHEQSGQPLVEQLKDVLATKQVLLVLDNVEHLVAAAPLVGDLLGGAPQLKVLATSRVPLRLRAEREYPVPPLGLPRRKPPPTAEQLSQYEAVRLFIDRAQSVKPGFAVDNVNAPALAEICHRLDGLPLAIELAAARVRMLSPQAMLARLEQRLPLLTGGARDAPARQQTLRNTIAWSYDLLAPEEQQLFRRLAVFAGGATFEALEAMASPNGDLDVFGGLERLVEQSLVRQEDGPDGEPRFTMLETIREFGLEQLEASGEGQEVRQRHAAVFLTLAEEAEPGLYGADERAWLERLDAEHDNLRAALQWSLEREPETALRLVAAVWRFWYVRGHLHEGQTWADRVLETSAGTVTITRGRVLNGAATLVAALGDVNRDYALNEASLALARELGDRMGQVRALHDLGVGSFEQGNLEPGRIFLEAAVSLARELGERWWVALGLNNLAEIAVHQGDLSGAMTLLEEALRLTQQTGLRSIMASVTTILGVVTEARGDLPSAISWHRQGLVLFYEVGMPGETIRTLHYLACAVLAQEYTEQATRLLSAVQSLYAALGIRMGTLDQVRYDAAVWTARASMSEALFTAAWDAGQALSLEEAVAQALVLANEMDLDGATVGQQASDVLLAPRCPL